MTTDDDRMPVLHPETYSGPEMLRRARDFRKEMQCRRSVRDFSDKPVPREVIAECLLTAGSAPSGANMQPWSFVAVSNPEVKRQIREAAEREEYALYHGLAGDEWLADLAHLRTNAQKPFLEHASYVIAVFAQSHGLLPDGSKKKHYYVRESVGIATGMLVTALHHAGLVALTYTPTRMGFLRELLGRTANERPFIVVVTGYPADGATVPNLRKKDLAEIATFVG